MKQQKVLVSGASGLIGMSLVRELTADSIQVVKLIRGGSDATQSPGRPEQVRWNPSAAAPVSDSSRLEMLDAAVHLSGAAVAGRRWTKSYKQEIVSSRVESTLTLIKVLAGLKATPRVLVCASAIGIYGDRGDELLTENSAVGTGFLAETCKQWEAAAATAERAGIRVVQVRFGVVLAPAGGALDKMLPLFSLGLGGKLGHGRQWMAWLTLRDAVGILRHCIDDEALHGPVNAVEPQPVTNAEFTTALAAAVHRPAVLPVPTFALRLAFGEMADESLLASARVMPAKLLASGFRFADPEIEQALRFVLMR